MKIVQWNRVIACGRTDRQTERQTDRQTDMMKLKVAFNSFANAPKTTSMYS